MVFEISSWLLLVFTIVCVFGVRKFLKQKNDGDTLQRFLTVPGLSPSNESLGNIPEITEAGSLHQFLTDIHKKFGPVVSFYYGKEKVLSTSHPDAFKPQINAFDRPEFMFKSVQPVFGEASIQYMNGEEGQLFRSNLDKAFSQSRCESHIPVFTELAENVAMMWSQVEVVESLHTEMLNFALRAIMQTSFGNFFRSDEACEEFCKNYDNCFKELDQYLISPQKPLSDEFFAALDGMKSQIDEIVSQRRSDTFARQSLLIDEIMAISKTEQQIFDLALTYATGFQTTGTLLTWIIYYLARNPDIQNEVRNEFNAVMGEMEELQDYHLKLLTFTRNVIDETMRVTNFAPYAGRYANKDLTIGGYFVPKDTPMFQALGVVQQNEDLWPEPEKFLPRRPGIVRQNYGDSLSCPFFGFAGDRKCPGFRMVYVEVYCMLSVLLSKFELTLSEPEKEIEKQIGFVTHPASEIFIHVSSIH